MTVSEQREPTFRRRGDRRQGVAVDARHDLDVYDELISSVPAGYPGLPLMLRRRAELAELAFGAPPKLELHIEGGDVVGNTTSADPFARLIRTLDQVVKDLTKSIFGISRLSSTLRVTPVLGSVVLIVEPPENDDREYRRQVASGPVERAEIAGLRRLVSVMVIASEDDDPTSSQINASIHDLNGSARNSLAAFAKATADARYELSGSWTDAEDGVAYVKLSPAAASRLQRAARETTDRVDRETITGKVDGWEWSSARVKFIPNQGRAFRASVPDRLAPIVARMVAAPDQEVVALFAVHTSVVRGGSQATRRGYSLESIRSVAVQDEIPSESKQAN